MGRFKSYFLRGLAVLLPTILTIGIFVWGYKFIQENISIHINRALVQLLMRVQGDTEQVTKDVLSKFWVDGWGSIAGFLAALVGVCIIGALLASVVGRTLWRMVEKFIMRTPFLKAVYPYIKQVTDFALKESKEDRLAFSRVVAAEYPRKGIWSIGLVTGNALTRIADNCDKELLTVFIPTSPTPFTGFVIMIPKEQTIDMGITIEEALRFTVSGGVIRPNSEQTVTISPQADSKGKQG